MKNILTGEFLSSSLDIFLVDGGLSFPVCEQPLLPFDLTADTSIAL